MASRERTETAQSTTTSAAPATTTSSSASAATSAPAKSGSTENRGGQSSGTETAEETISKGLRCDLLMNARYHASREAFLDTVHRLLMFSIIVLGAAAVTDLFNAPWIKSAFAACAVIFAAIDLTADLSNRARCHALMKRRYFELLADLVKGRSPVEIEEHMHRYSADEEPVFNALLAVSWNAAQEMVYGSHAHAYKVPGWHRFLKNIRRYGNVKYDFMDGTSPATA